MDDDSAGSAARRRRRRRPQEATSPAPDGASGVAARPERSGPQRRPRAADGAERGLRDIVGAGPSQLGVVGAMRGRDVNRPTEVDLAEAERTLVIVRRNWQAPDGKK